MLHTLMHTGVEEVALPTSNLFPWQDNKDIKYQHMYNIYRLPQGKQAR